MPSVSHAAVLLLKKEADENLAAWASERGVVGKGWGVGGVVEKERAAGEQRSNNPAQEAKDERKGIWVKIVRNRKEG